MTGSVKLRPEVWRAALASAMKQDAAELAWRFPADPGRASAAAKEIESTLWKAYARGNEIARLHAINAVLSMHATAATPFLAECKAAVTEEIDRAVRSFKFER
jgi:hypothetical protein